MLCIFPVILTILFLGVSCIDGYTTEDVHVNSGECTQPAQFGDHVLLEYSILLANGSFGSVLKRPSQLFHTILKPELKHLPIISSIVGLCPNEIRKIIWNYPSEIELEPIFHDSQDITQGLQIDITLVELTTAQEYQIFDAINSRNLSLTLDYIDQHIGVNSVDEWGHTPLITAIQLKQMDMIAALLNSRNPKVDVNKAKPSGYTALFYAVQKAPISIITGLLKRGANPNAIILQEGSRGNTPLHFACLLENTKVIELLLEHGANPMMVNQFGQTPLQLYPSDAVRSTKLYLKKIFEAAAEKIQRAEEANKNEITAQMSSARSDM